MKSAIFIYFLSICHVGYAEPWVATSPTDGMYKVGSTITLNCQISDVGDGSVYWAKSPDFSASVCTGINNQGLCVSNYPRLSMTVNRITNSYNLIITGAQLDDGGGYQCYPDNASVQRSLVAIIIIVDTPTIQVSDVVALDADIPISASVTFQSIPYVQLMQLPGLKPTAYLTVKPNFLISSSVNNFTDQTTTRVTMNAKGIVNLVYENLPAVVEFWLEISQPYLKISSSKNLNVEYGPRNIQIKPQPIADKMGNVYGQDTTLTCSAAGNPSPTLTLTAVETDTGKPVDSLPMNKHDEVSVTLGADWLALTHTLTCTATNKPMTALGVREHVSSMAKVTFTVIHKPAARATQALSQSRGTQLGLALIMTLTISVWQT